MAQVATGNDETTTADGLPHVKLFTDGACLGNPGPGGWGFILRHVQSGRSRREGGGEHHTTNNRMEIMAVIRGLEALRKPSRVELVSDSRYVVNAITDWMPRWKRFGWKKSPNTTKALKNADLWRRLDEAMRGHRLNSTWVRGHDGHAENEQCDLLATTAAQVVAATPAPPRPPSAPSMTAAAAGAPGLFAAMDEARKEAAR